ncbi:spinster family MFS transporter [Hyphococcus lacteus]|uniref:MFS transporter n=1 Tax=Hyphococcus lacteus TaxID=3143536 RepID=A0ABV3Z035_9PROT
MEKTLNAPVPASERWRFYSSTQRWTFLFILFLVGTSSSMDRVVISILLEPIKQEFDVTDTQLGLLSGLSFAIFYSILGIPIARLADHGDRPLLISISITIWSGMTMLCAAAAGYWHLLLARIGVSIGEAGGTPPAQSLIVDYFPRASRARAIGIFTTSGTAGYLIGLSVGSQIVVAYGWRGTLIAFGLPGLLIAAAVFLILKEPRKAGGNQNIAQKSESFRISIRCLMAKPAYIKLLVAHTVYAFAAYGSLLFVPSYLVRVIGSPIEQSGFYFGITSGIAVLIGSLAGGSICDVLSKRDARWVAWFPAAGFALATLPNALMFLVNDLFVFLIVSFFGGLLLYASLPAAFSAVHAVCGTKRRATSIALVLFFGNLIGFGLGPVVTGALSDMFSKTYGQEGLRYALLIIMLLTSVAAGLFYSAGQTIRKDMED